MAARKPAARRRKPVKRTSQVRKPRANTRGQKAATWLAMKIGEASEKHGQTVMSRKDAAILRYTHEGCHRCKGNGQIFTKGKDGSFTGSKACPAKPTRAKAGRMRVAIAARFGRDKNSGLVGWTCPCGSKEKPRFRDAKDATKALRTHERKKHGGKTVGGAWYAQVADGAAPTKSSAPTAPTPPAGPVSKVVTDSGKSDAEWIKQNKPVSQAAAKKRGTCWSCTGGVIYSAFGGEQVVVVCPVCRGTGKSAIPATATA